METIKINSHGCAIPEQHGEWVDLFTAEDVYMKKGDFKVISLGVSMELPEGYYAEIVPRSSTFGRYRVIMTNSVGIIDSDYCGDNDIWGFPAYAVEDTHIPNCTRICQFRLVKNPDEVEFESVKSLGNKDRGGFGSTGE